MIGTADINSGAHGFERSGVTKLKVHTFPTHAVCSARSSQRTQFAAHAVRTREFETRAVRANRVGTSSKTCTF